VTSLISKDVWAKLRAETPARIGLGRSGDALPSQAVLGFDLAHARARDAVHWTVDFDALTARLPSRPVIQVHSAARDRKTYLLRPDLGRRLDDASAARLTGDSWDVVFIIADGLSASAIKDQSADTLTACIDRLPGWSIAPIVLAQQARVALGDEIGQRLGARLSCVLIGERPGLSVANSLGIYMTWDPRPGRTDADRNCISNIHGRGLSPAQAADTLVGLMNEARRHELSGVSLKADQIAAISGPLPD
jgi:ethanolamine ammonia-lyase small subunit